MVRNHVRIPWLLIGCLKGIQLHHGNIADLIQYSINGIYFYGHEHRKMQYSQKFCSDAP
jgi:hypothetical protein